jgi:hypothetical protein
MVGSPATLDPYSEVASDLTYALVRPVYPSLYRLSPAGRPVPFLARRLDPIAGGARVFLRSMRWNDGSPVTSRDVVASIERAHAPSGFERVRRARALSRRVVRLEGAIRDWPRALATLSFVLPDGRARHRGGGLVGGSGWRVARYRPGLKVVYARNRNVAPESRPYLDRATVWFYETESVLLDALRGGDLDVAVPPSTINLDDRLEQMGVVVDDALGWESVWVDLHQTLSRRERAGIVDAISRKDLEDNFVRDGGRIARTLHPGPRGRGGPWRAGYGKRSQVPDGVRLSIPSGDELLFLMQRAIQIELARRDVHLDLIAGSAADFYGPWRSESPADVALMRSAGAPGLRDPRRSFRKVTAFPITHVRTYLAWHPRVTGPEVNPTFDGPLWNLASWWLSPRR